MTDRLKKRKTEEREREKKKNQSGGCRGEDKRDAGREGVTGLDSKASDSNL